jgi:hypothetical protein
MRDYLINLIFRPLNRVPLIVWHQVLEESHGLTCAPTEDKNTPISLAYLGQYRNRRRSEASLFGTRGWRLVGILCRLFGVVLGLSQFEPESDLRTS